MERLLKDYSNPGKIGVFLPEEETKKPEDLLPDRLLREKELDFPEVSEPEVVRHYIKLSVMNHHVDKDFYPLGSCTMKYNPKINDKLAALPGFSEIHPEQPEETVQGALKLMYELEKYLEEITGMKAVTLQPAAGSHGELTGTMIIQKYHQLKGNQKKYILIPDSAHGTNPSSASSVDYDVVSVKSNDKGCIDPEDLEKKLSDEVAGMMITNPNTLGLFEEEIEKINKMIHDYDGIIYMDGANLNALFGVAKPADMGFDIVHMNLHKTFSTPHGGGGPGSGPIGVVEELEPYLPVPRIVKNDDIYSLSTAYPQSIGRMLGYYGHFGVIVRAYTYISMLGEEGLKEVSRNAVLNANYIRKKLSRLYDIPFNRPCMHEFVASGQKHKKEYGVKALDIAKRMLDYGVHAPTVYFPLVVKEAMMIEPTETEAKQNLDKFINIMEKIDKEAKQDPDKLKHAPYETPVRRLDELKANKELNVKW
jgi:glycine dehydrogenase subunit 2